jgi:hypothetical protein
MGTIVLNEMIHNYPTLPCSNIVYMAAACTIRDFNLSVVPYLQYHGTNAQFYNLVLHPRNDALERSFGDIPPRGSLLEWIDNFLASPQTPVDRTLGKWENIIQATHTIPPEVRGRVHIKAFGSSRDENFPEGNPQTHGSFGTNQFWRTEFWQPHVPPQSP